MEVRGSVQFSDGGAVTAAITQLNGWQKQLLSLHLVEDLSVGEISLVTGATESQIARELLSVKRLLGA
jgi:hypothetical protein